MLDSDLGVKVKTVHVSASIFGLIELVMLFISANSSNLLHCLLLLCDMYNMFLIMSIPHQLLSLMFKIPQLSPSNSLNLLQSQSIFVSHHLCAFTLHLSEQDLLSEQEIQNNLSYLFVSCRNACLVFAFQ